MKKAEMSINIVVVAAIALLLLVILAYLVASKLGWFDSVTKCGGTSTSLCADSCQEGYSQQGSGKAAGCKEEQICCVKVNGDANNIE
jgi:hypothetical protein